MSHDFWPSIPRCPWICRGHDPTPPFSPTDAARPRLDSHPAGGSRKRADAFDDVHAVEETGTYLQGDSHRQPVDIHRRILDCIPYQSEVLSQVIISTREEGVNRNEFNQRASVVLLFPDSSGTSRSRRWLRTRISWRSWTADVSRCGSVCPLLIWPSSIGNCPPMRWWGTCSSRSEPTRLITGLSTTRWDLWTLSRKIRLDRESEKTIQPVNPKIVKNVPQKKKSKLFRAIARLLWTLSIL